jgi:hypothetical protein
VKVGYAAGMVLIMPAISTPETVALNAFMAGIPLVDFVLKLPVLRFSFAVIRDPLPGNVGDPIVSIISREVDAAMSSFIRRVPSATKKIDSSLFFNARKGNVISNIET